LYIGNRTRLEYFYETDDLSSLSNLRISTSVTHPALRVSAVSFSKYAVSWAGFFSLPLINYLLFFYIIPFVSLPYFFFFYANFNFVNMAPVAGNKRFKNITYTG
jgi:hypothetical protein